MRLRLAIPIVATVVLALPIFPIAASTQPVETETFSSAAMPIPGAPVSAAQPGRLGTAYVPGVDVRITTSPSPQNETYIISDPNNPNVVIGGFNDYRLGTGFGGNGVAYSPDGGVTWVDLGPAVLLPVGFTRGGGDPGLAFNSAGRAFYSHIAGGTGANNFSRNNGVFVASSTTGGATWGATSAVAQNLFVATPVPFEDKPFSHADHHAGSPFQDRAYVSWTRFYPAAHPNGGTGGGDIYVGRSVDNGLTWTNVRVTTLAHEPSNAGTGTAGSSFVQGSEPEVEPDGDVYMAYWFGGRINVTRSVDGGATWSLPTFPAGAAFGTASIPSPLPNETFRVNAFPSIETDPTRPHHVYVVFPDDDDTPAAADQANIFFARSTNNGAAWGPRIKLNDDALTRNQVFPWMAVNDNGDIMVIWYDTRLDPLNHLLDVYCTISRDGGVTWSPNMRVTDASFEPNTGQFGGNTFFGDYNGAAAGGTDAFHVLWTDTRTGGVNEQEIYYDRKCDPEVALVCAPPVAGDHYQDLQVNFCVTNSGCASDNFDYQLTDPKGWVVGSSAPLSGTVNLAPGAQFCITVTIHLPINCTQGEINTMCWTVTPQSAPSRQKSCCTEVTCISPTATAISNFVGTVDGDAAQLEYVLPDERGLLGVDIYRAAGSGEFARITTTMIPVRGLGTYRYTDTGLERGVTYRYQLGLTTTDGEETRLGLVSLYVERAEFTLGEPFPNPSEEGFSVRLSMPVTGDATLRVYDVHGREVRTLHRGTLTAGEHSMVWDGRTERGTPARGGLYFLTYETGGQKAQQRLVLMR